MSSNGNDYFILQINIISHYNRALPFLQQFYFMIDFINYDNDDGSLSKAIPICYVLNKTWELFYPLSKKGQLSHIETIFTRWLICIILYSRWYYTIINLFRNNNKIYPILHIVMPPAQCYFAIYLNHSILLVTKCSFIISQGKLKNTAGDNCCVDR